MPAAATTSAGVYKTDGTLIRTLWSGKPLPAGSNKAVWDGLDSTGQPMIGGAYQIKLIHHNITYTWEGTIGNTSTQQTGTTVHRAFQTTNDMVIVGTGMFFANGYNEGQALFRRAETTDPNSVSFWSRVDQARCFRNVTSDGTNVYFTNVGSGWVTPKQHFVAAYKASDNTQVAFSSGVSVASAGGGSTAWTNVIDYGTGDTEGASGIAVQKTGSYLFVAHKGVGVIRVLDKTTGALVRSEAIPDVEVMAATSDNNLWVVATESGARVVRRYNVDGAGNLTPAAVITGLANPVAVSVSPDNSTVAVADGGTSQQVKGFSNISSGTPAFLWTLGTAGGYNSTNGPNVSTSKFCFSINGVDQTYISYAPDGSFWVGDRGNYRSLHFSSGRAYIDQIMYLSKNYDLTVCAGDPTRLFTAEKLEFSIDYSQPLRQGWSLVRNWNAGLPTTYGAFKAVVKMSNGRVYGLVSDEATNTQTIIELPASGPARQTGLTVTGMLHEDGSLRRATRTLIRQTVYIKNLTGFDGSNNPVWGAESVLASAPCGDDEPQGGSGYLGSGGPRYPSTSTGRVIISDGRGNGKYVYHLGSVAQGGTDWTWKAAPSSRYFDGHGNVGAYCEYPANNAYTLGRSILLGCHGEFYSPPEGGTGQANQWMQFYDNGLFVGEFGVVRANLPNPGVNAGVAGNAFSSAFVQVGSDTYVWHNDESHAGGVHRWKVNNASSIVEITVNVTLPSTPGNGTGLTGQYFDGLNFDTLKLTRTDAGVNFAWDYSPSTSAGMPDDNFTVRWSGLVEPLYSETYTFTPGADDKCRLWVDGTLLVDKWATSGGGSGTITLQAGEKYPIVMEMQERTSRAGATLRWSSASQPLQFIPYQQLYPSGAIAINCAGPAVGRFQADPFGTTGGAVATTTSTINTSAVTDPAPMSVYQSARKRESRYLFYLDPLTNYKVRLHLAEFDYRYYGIGERVFPVSVNGLGGITPKIDIFETAGGSLKAITRDFVATTDGAGLLMLKFGVPDDAFIGGIEVLRDVSNPASNPSFAVVGVGTGLKGQYYSGTDFNTLIHTRVDPQVNFDWGTTEPLPSLGTTNYSMRWTGKVQTVEAGTYTFKVEHYNGARLWVNNVLLIDQWAANGSHTATIDLAASTAYDIKLEYKHTTGSTAKVRLAYNRPTLSEVTLPQSQIYPAP